MDVGAGYEHLMVKRGNLITDITRKSQILRFSSSERMAIRHPENYGETREWQMNEE